MFQVKWLKSVFPSFVVFVAMAACAPTPDKKYYEFDVRNFDELSSDQQQCMRWAEPVEAILKLDFAGKKRSILNFSCP